MARTGPKRRIAPVEDSIWLGVLLDAAFDATSQKLDLWTAAEAHNRKTAELGMVDATKLDPREGRSQLLQIAIEYTNYPGDYQGDRLAMELLAWINRWVQPEDWVRLSARVRKRRHRMQAG